MSKESKAKKRAKQLARKNLATDQPTPPKKQQFIRPVGQIRPRSRFNKRFIIMFAIWVVALALALYFLMR